MTEHMKIHIREQSKVYDDVAEITDVKTDGMDFYEEISSKRAEHFVKCWNAFEAGGSHDALLEDRKLLTFARETLLQYTGENKWNWDSDDVLGMIYRTLISDKFLEEQAISQAETENA